jgi:Flp pilus assembly protein TadD
MDRSIKTGRLTAPRLALAVTTAIAGLALSGCMTAAAPRAEVSSAHAQTALSKGKFDKAVAHAEAAVLADPRNPSFRALLGAAYLKAGRFQSAATSFGDALDLGDANQRTVLSYALTRIALGDHRAALAALDEHSDALDPADYGLALSLAGEPLRGTGVLVAAVRASEEASPKLRQNLAYSYALAGNWRAARVMAAEDVPADQLDARLSQWAAVSGAEMSYQRVATLLGVTPQVDAGLPQQLALANFPAPEVMVAEAAAQAMPAALPEAPSATTFAEAFPASQPSFAAVGTQGAGPRNVAADGPSAPRSRTTARPIVAQPVTASAPAPALARTGGGTHLVQLGAFTTRIDAERGWTIATSKFPQLKDRKPVITQALVNGRTFWRLAAGGFGQQSAMAMCSSMKSAGHGCFAYAAANPPKGAVARDVRVASRSR